MKSASPIPNSFHGPAAREPGSPLEPSVCPRSEGSNGPRRRGLAASWWVAARACLFSLTSSPGSPAWRAPRKHATQAARSARTAVGELITCPFCIDLWVATGLMAGFIYLPRTTRLAIETLAVLTGADLLQFGYARLQEQEQS